MTPHPRKRRILPAAAVASVIAGILFVTLDRFELPPPHIQWWEWCFRCGQQWGVDFVLNVALFIPLGLALRLARVPPFPSLLGIAATSFEIEVLQLVIPGRITSIDDLVANTLGGILGFVVGGHLRAIVAPPARQAIGALFAAGAFVFVVLWGTLWLFQPAPTNHPYWGQFAPQLGQFALFTGSVIEASVADQPLRNGRLPNTDAVRERLRQDSVTVRAVAHGGEMYDRLAPVVSIFDGEHNEVMLMGRSGGRSFTFRLRMRATNLGLNTPNVSVWRAFPRPENGGRDKIVLLSGTVRGYSITASAKTDSSCVTRTIDFRPTQGWAYLLPFENLITRRAVDFTTIWLAMIFSPLGYYAAVAVARRREGTQRFAVMLWVTTIAALALVALPLAVGLSAGTAAEWRGVLIGLVSGAVIGAAATAWARSREHRPVTYN